MRMRHLRQRGAVDAPRRKQLIQLERDADYARARYLYAEALSRYEEALGSPGLRRHDERRLSEKCADALFFGYEPERARAWLERALEAYRRGGIRPGNADAAGTLLLRLSRQYWLNAETTSALPLISEAIQLGTLARNEAFLARANLAMAHYLILLGRHEEAEPFFSRAGTVRANDPPEMRAVGYDQRAILYAARGIQDEAYVHFQAAIDAAKLMPDGYQITAIWDDYGIWAMALGDIETAQHCKERALLVAREWHVTWRIPYLSLRYADLLIQLEQYEHARNLVLDALTYDCKTPSIKILVASVGIRLASALDDDSLLHRCFGEAATEDAFRSGEPGRIGPLVSAAVNSLAARGETGKAKHLLSRGLAALVSADHACDLLVDAAALGNEHEQESARRLLQSRATMRCGGLAAAYLELFDATLAKRGKNSVAQFASARRAASAFRRIGWLSQEKRVLALCAKRAEQRGSDPTRTFRTMLGDASMLTKREAEVADLALKGLTNREIAKDLSISEHTVESHMTSIMNRLGIRSRHQLSNLLMDSGMASPL